MNQTTHQATLNVFQGGRIPLLPLQRRGPEGVVIQLPSNEWRLRELFRVEGARFIIHISEQFGSRAEIGLNLVTALQDDG